MFGELSKGQRSQDRPKLHYKDVCKDTMKHLQIDPKSCMGKNGVRSCGLEDCGVHRSRTTGRDPEAEWKRSAIEGNRECVKRPPSQILTPSRAVTAAGPVAQILAGLATSGATARETGI